MSYQSHSILDQWFEQNFAEKWDAIALTGNHTRLEEHLNWLREAGSHAAYLYLHMDRARIAGTKKAV